MKSCNSLLKILSDNSLDVSSSVGGLIGQKEKCVIRTVAPGEYVHIGLERQLEKAKDLLQQHSILELDIGIDGLPLFKSSAIGLWPILGKIVNEPSVSIFVIGTYVGKSKPHNVDSFLHDFVEEIKSINQGEFFKIKIRAFICDAPARSFICGTKGHIAINGCHWCCQRGNRIGHRTSFSSCAGPRRTDDFKS